MQLMNVQYNNLHDPHQKQFSHQAVKKKTPEETETQLLIDIFIYVDILNISKYIKKENRVS